MLKYNIERCSKLLTFNPKQIQTDEQSRVTSIVAADTPIRAIKMPKKKVLISANRMSTSAGDQQQSVCSLVLYGDSQVLHNKENSRQTINEMRNSSQREEQTHNDSHFYLETSMCGSGSRRRGSSRRMDTQEDISRESFMGIVEKYQMQARSTAKATKTLTQLVVRHAYLSIKLCVEGNQSSKERRARKLKRLLLVVRNIHTRQPFHEIASIQLPVLQSTLSRLTRHIAIYAYRQFLHRLRLQQNLHTEQDIRKISQFLNDKQHRLDLTVKKGSVRLLINALQTIYHRKARLLRFVDGLLDQLQTLKPETSRFASSSCKPAPTATFGGKGHIKSYSFSRIVQEDA